MDLGTLTCNPRGEFWRCGQPFTMCPDKQVALAVLLSEVDEKEGASPGMKNCDGSRAPLPGLPECFGAGYPVHLPEDLNVSGTPGKALPPRNLRVRLFSHYVDYDFQCCNVTVTCKQ